MKYKQYIDVSKVMISAEVMKDAIEGNFTILLSGDNPTGEISLQGSTLAKNKLGIHLFPNPAKDVFEIQLPVATDKETPTYQVEIFDNLGRSVFFEAATNESLSVKTMGWTSGLYHVLLTDKVGGEVVGLKIVVE